MTQRGYPEKASLPPNGAGIGMYQAGSPVNGNLAVQASIMEIFDEFTEVISGELKLMNQDAPGEPKA